MPDNIVINPRKTFVTLLHSGKMDSLKPLWEFLSFVEQETRRAEEQRRSHYEELRARVIQSASGNLAPFLTTPLKSDATEIERILGEQFSLIADQCPDIGSTGITRLTVAEVQPDAHGTGLPAKAVARARQVLAQSLGVETKSHTHYLLTRFELDARTALRTFHLAVARAMESLDVTNIAHTVCLDTSELMRTSEAVERQNTPQFEALFTFERDPEQWPTVESRLHEAMDFVLKANPIVTICLLQKAGIPLPIHKFSFLLTSQEQAPLLTATRMILSYKPFAKGKLIREERSYLVFSKYLTHPEGEAH